MTTDSSPRDKNPPRWAEHLLRGMLTSANRDTITGDLLEEYREVVRPTRGAVGARLWYLRQCMSLALASNSPAQRMIWLAAAGAIVVAFFMRYYLPPGFPYGAWGALAIFASAVLFMRPSDVSFLWRISVAFGILFGAMAVTVSVVATLVAPLADQHAALMAFGGLGTRLVVACCAAVSMAAGVYGAWRGRRLSTGTLSAIGSGVVGASVLMGLATGIAKVSPALPRSAFVMPASPAMLNVFVDNILMFALFSIVPGVLGAMFGKVLSVVLDRRGANVLEGTQC